jgi:agmatinase
MRLLHSLPPYNFMGLERELSNFSSAKVAILPVPYDSTASYRSGARDGPRAILQASRNMELYDDELGYEPSIVGISTLDELEPSMKSPEETIKRVEKVFDELIENKKFPIMLGGEHSLTIGAVKAFRGRYADLSVLQLDAHADLRDEYQGTKYNHACTARRLRELCNVVPVGIRSMSKEEADYVRENKVKMFYARDAKKWKFDEILSSLKKRVYISVDLDVFDPSEMPAVGTPEPGGLHWYDVMGIVREVSRKREIVGFDAMELAPIPQDISSDFLAGKLVYKIIGYVFAKE